MERVILYDKEFYVRESDKKETGLPFEFLPFNEVSRIIDLNARNPRKRVKLESEVSYIPIKVEKAKNSGNYIDIVNLSPNDNTDLNIKGIKSNIRRSASRPVNAFSTRKTEGDACYGIKKATIFGEEYFFPHVETSRTDKQDKLDFYLIPVKGAKIKIKNSNGNVSIINNDQVYRPLEKSVIKAREEKLVTEKREKIRQERLAAEAEKDKAKQENNSTGTTIGTETLNW